MGAVDRLAGGLGGLAITPRGKGLGVRREGVKARDEGVKMTEEGVRRLHRRIQERAVKMTKIAKINAKNKVKMKVLKFLQGKEWKCPILPCTFNSNK